MYKLQSKTTKYTESFQPAVNNTHTHTHNVAYKGERNKAELPMCQLLHINYTPYIAYIIEVKFTSKRIYKTGRVQR